MEEMDKKVYRILNTKYEYGLFHDYAQDDADPEAVINSSRLVQLSKDVAKRSTIVCRDKDNLLPLRPEERVLVIEQRNNFYNTPKWHSGILFENCLNYSSNVTYLETGFRWSEEDLDAIKASIGSYDKIVITNCYNRSFLCNKDELIQLLDSTDKDIVVITTNIYEEISVPHNAKTVLTTFGLTPNSAEVLAGVLYGKINAEGIWPVEHHA
jgi:hypothetical protein